MLNLLILFALFLNSHSIINNKVIREFDVKGNILFAKYSIAFKLEGNESSPLTYVFPLEFPRSSLSAISFYIDDNKAKAKYNEEFVLFYKVIFFLHFRFFFFLNI